LLLLNDMAVFLLSLKEKKDSGDWRGGTLLDHLLWWNNSVQGLPRSQGRQILAGLIYTAWKGPHNL
jgi:hypothetical protein